MKFGLIGHPISHSQSPKLFKEDIENSGHTYDLIETPNFDDAYNIFLEKYDAVNVTMPFKTLAFKKGIAANRETAIIGATNLLKKAGNTVNCYNTDYLGVKSLLSDYILEKDSVLVIGCGGAGKAAALAAYDSGFCVSIANRTIETAKNWVEKNHFNDMQYYDLNNAPIIKNDIIIYTLPTLPEKFPLITLNGKIVIEANYSSASLANHKGIDTYISGEEWLMEQAYFGFKLMRQKIC